MKNIQCRSFQVINESSVSVEGKNLAILIKARVFFIITLFIPFSKMAKVVVKRLIGRQNVKYKSSVSHECTLN